jgi:hypothetical protein
MLKAADQVKGQGKGEAAASFAEREDVAEGEQGGAAMGNLAAMAAASAAKRGKGKVERLDLGGLAAMAAAAASKREHKMTIPTNADLGLTKGGTTEVLRDQSPDNGGHLSRVAADVVGERGRPDLSGLAAMAARAASKRQQQADAGHNDAMHVKQERSTVGSVAELPVAAAAPRSEDQQVRQGSGNVAAMAAEAAQKRNVMKSDVSDAGGAAAKLSLGDIAGMAAAAALKRTQEQQSIGTTKKPALNRSEEAPDSGNIAMIAAAATTMRTQSNDERPPLGGLSETGNREPSGTSLSIGCAVATDASGASNESEGQTTPQREIRLSAPSHVPTPAPTPFGGIAAMAAAAAAKRMQDQLAPPELGGNAALKVLGDPEPTTGGSHFASTVTSTSSHTDSGQALALGQTDREFLLEMGLGPTPASTQRLENISDIMKNSQETDIRSFSDAVGNTGDSSASKLVRTTTSTEMLAERPKKESLVGTTLIEQGPNELTSKAAAKKRSSSEDDGGDDTSSGGESTSSKKLKSSPHHNGDNVDDFLVFPPTNMNDDSMRGDDASMSLSLDDPTLGSVPSFPDDVVQTNRHSEYDGVSKESFSTAESTEELGLSTDEVLSPFESRASNKLSRQKSQSSSTDHDVSVGEDSRKGNGRRSKKKKKKNRKAPSEEKGVESGEQVGPQSSSVHDIGVTPDEKAGLDIIRQKFSLREQEADARSRRSRKQLSPLRSEAYTPARRLDSDATIDHTIERFLVTLDDEVAVAGNLHNTKAMPSVDQGFQELSAAKPTSRPEETHITESSHETPTKANVDEKMDVGNPLQRWFQGLGGSREISDMHTSKEKLSEEKGPALPPTDDNDKDNLFVNIFRQISGRDISTKSLPTDSEAPAEEKKT